MSILLLVIYYLSFQIFFKKEIVELLNSNLPFREAYSPSIIGVICVYVLPILFGFLFGGIFSSIKQRSVIYFVNLGLLAGLLNYLPFAFNTYFSSIYWFNNHALIYYLLLFPVLFLVGSLPYYLNISTEDAKGKNLNYKITRLDLIITSVLGLFIFILNIIPVTLSEYLVGADIYYHASLTQKLTTFLDLTKNPFFYNEKNYYYSIAYVILAFVSRVFNISVKHAWFFYIPVSATVFVIFFYLFSKRYLGYSIAALFATLFVLPLNQILWVDPSVRILSYMFFAMLIFTFQSYILTKKIRHLLLSLLFLFLTAASHPEIAIHSVGIIALYFILYYFKSLKLTFEKFTTPLFNKLSKIPDGIHVVGLENFYSFLVLISIYLFILFSKYTTAMEIYSIDKLLVFNEIPLSIFNPIGIISFIVFIFAPFGVMNAYKRFSDKDILMLSIFSLFFTVVFYFSLLWFLYHRYFTETAYLSIAILSAGIIYKLVRDIDFTKKVIMILVLLGFFILSIIPKYQFINVYAKSTNKNLKSKINDLNFLKNNTQSNSVILLDSDNILNRYIPFYSERYIFSGNSLISKERQWQVLSFCNGPFSATCNERSFVAESFFAAPSILALGEIKDKYKIDYLLLNKNDPNEIDIFDNSDLNLRKYKVSETENYILYSLKNY
ncbi:hypothetical protein A2688_02770 [Candidatus Daviesbacteria bacterium RIFCSPHIGHO2_01_FULL_38_8]|nr:MAG: hypothetical protein A2688_02770 [Candidatus Daviesbacteria bacterium RIFCSPHIGHO2_01_FULL_38_8]